MVDGEFVIHAFHSNAQLVKNAMKIFNDFRSLHNIIPRSHG
jgi:hypothetical protein